MNYSKPTFVNTCYMGIEDAERLFSLQNKLRESIVVGEKDITHIQGSHAIFRKDGYVGIVEIV